MAKEKEYYVSGCIEYAANISTYVYARNKKEAKEKALQEFNEKSGSMFPEMQSIIVDPPIQSNS